MRFTEPGPRVNSEFVSQLGVLGLGESEDFLGAIVGHGASKHGLLGFVDLVEVQPDGEKT